MSFDFFFRELSISVSCLVAKNFMTLSTEKRSCNKFQSIYILNSVEDGRLDTLVKVSVDDYAFFRSIAHLQSVDV